MRRHPFCWAREVLLDAVIVGAPVGDMLFDGFGFEALGEGFVDEGGKLVVGGEAEGDELLRGEFLDVTELGDGKNGGEAEALFEADDAVLQLQVVHSALGREAQERCGDDDPPEEQVTVPWPVVDGGVDGEDEVEHQNWEHEEVHEGIEAVVVLEVLRSGHLRSFRGFPGSARLDGPLEASAYHCGEIFLEWSRLAPQEATGKARTG
jgi:hypothetical protein